MVTSIIATAPSFCSHKGGTFVTNEETSTIHYLYNLFLGI
jgi:hypothetical protein